MSQNEPIERLLKRAVEGFGAGAGPCLDPERLVAFYEGRLLEVEMEPLRDHIAGCAACTALAREVRGFLSQPAARPAPPRAVGRRALQIAALLAVGALLGLFLARSWDRPGKPLADLTWQEVLPTLLGKPEWVPPAPSAALLWRDGEPLKGEARKDPFLTAMETYAREEFASAASALRSVLEENPFHEPAALYAGISLLLDQKPVEAVGVLEQLAATATEDWMRSQALWYGALARLKADQPQAALALIDRLLAQPPDSLHHRAFFLRALLARPDKR